jgi:hypothetical protein
VDGRDKPDHDVETDRVILWVTKKNPASLPGFVISDEGA